MKLQDVAEMGYVMGLETIDEAFDCIERHYLAFPPGAVDAAHADRLKQSVPYDTVITRYLGLPHCRALDRKTEESLREQG
jgi:hypothetical protein